MRLATRKNLKMAAQWAALSILAVALVVAASLIGAEMAGEPSQVGWALAKLASVIAFALCLLGWICNAIEDN